MVNRAEVEMVRLERHDLGGWRLRTAAGPGTSALRGVSQGAIVAVAVMKQTG